MGCLVELNTKNEIMIRRLAQLPRIAVPLLKKTIKTEFQSAMEEDKAARARQYVDHIYGIYGHHVATNDFDKL